MINVLTSGSQKYARFLLRAAQAVNSFVSVNPPLDGYVKMQVERMW